MNTVTGKSIIGICLVLSVLMLGGCGTHKEYNVSEVSYMSCYGDRDGAKLIIISSDKNVKEYVVEPYSDSGIDLFKGEIPSEDQCTIKEYTISEDEWNGLVEAINTSDFMSLPEELPKVSADDGSTSYIEVVTSEETHKSGGYCAGGGSGDEHKRYSQVHSKLYGIILKK